MIQLLAFTLFGLGAWILSIGFLIFTIAVPLSKENKTKIMQRAIHHAFRVFLGALKLLRGMDFDTTGLEKLRRPGPGLVIANHPSLLDVVLIISQMPQADCIVKKELWENYFLRKLLTDAGFISNGSGDQIVSLAISKIKNGRKVIIFPEGTRSMPTGMRPFSHGFSHIAVRAGCPIFPVLIHCDPPALTKNLGLFSVPRTRARLTAKLKDTIEPTDFFDPSDSTSIAVRKVTAGIQNYFEENLHLDRNRKN